MPTSKKFEKVTRVVDTGNSMSVYLENLAFKAKMFKKRPNELFKRIKCSILARLLVETSFLIDLGKLESLSKSAIDRSSTTFDMAQGQDRDLVHQRFLSNQDSHIFPQLASNFDSNIISVYDLPFLILDVRNKDEYTKSHIVTALHYNPAKLQSAYQFTQEIIRFRDDPVKLIVIYDHDETIAPQVAQSFAERGINNVWLLSGGLNMLKHKFASAMMENDASSLSQNFNLEALKNAVYESEMDQTISDMASVKSYSGRLSKLRQPIPSRRLT